MKKSDWSCLILGFLLTTATACRPVTDENGNQVISEPAATVTSVTAIGQQPTSASPTSPQPTITPPPQPTPAPTSNIPGNWRQVGSGTAGLQLSVPPGWVNLSGRLDTATATNELGLIVLLLADSERTGSSLLAGKEISKGAFATGLVTNMELAPSAPVPSLEQIVAETNLGLTPISQVTPITVTSSSGAIAGARVDVTGDPTGFFAEETSSLRNRLLLFILDQTTTPVPSNKTAQIVLMLSAPIQHWDSYADVFSRMTETVTIHDLQSGFTISEGAANVVGNLEVQDLVNGDLEPEMKDIWTFNTAGARYATLTLTPESETLDLTLAVISPSGQTVSRIDNGYAGDIEVAADLLLDESGRYIVEVGEFFGASGLYSLSLVLTDEPLLSGGGRIEIGQGIQSVLPVGGQHIWTFEGTASQVVSVVLTPGNEQFDAILDLYGPDGRRLAALDEGFSGDPEVISGLELPVTGEYSIHVRSFADGSGSYSLSLDEGGEDTLNFYDAGDLAYGDVREETLRANEAHAWFFEGKMGDEVVIEVVPLDEILDLDVWVLDSEVNRLAEEDDFLAGEAEMLEMTLPQDGQYLVMVRDYFGEPGDYEISLAAMPAELPDYVGTLDHGQTVEGSLAPGQMVVWLFSGNEGDIIDVTLTPQDNESDMVLLIQDPNERTVLEVDETMAGESEALNSFTLTADGQWGIVVKEFFNAESAYTLTLESR